MYTVKKVSDLAGVSLKALRHYDNIGLLPSARGENGYRYYSDNDLNILQQILFYKELDFSLKDIKKILENENFEIAKSLERQINQLNNKINRLEGILNLAKKTLNNMKGETSMSEKEKFEAFKDKMIDDNDRLYGAEVKEKYGKKAYEDSKKSLKGLTKEEYLKLEELTKEVNETFVKAFKNSQPGSTLANEAVTLHKKWLSYYWGEVKEEAHIGLGKMYVDDERFKSYYDGFSMGLAVFIRDSIIAYYS